MFAPQAPTGVRACRTPIRGTAIGRRASACSTWSSARRSTTSRVLTGDIHSSWAYDLPRRPFDGYDKATGKGSLGVEFAGTSVSSPSNLGAGPDGAKQLAGMLAARPHLHYVDGRYRGYFVLDLTRERLQADFYGVATVDERTHQGAVREGIHHRIGSKPSDRGIDAGQRPAPIRPRSDRAVPAVPSARFLRHNPGKS